MKQVAEFVECIVAQLSARRDVFRPPRQQNSFSKLLLITLLLLKYIRCESMKRQSDAGGEAPFKISPNQHKIASYMRNACSI